MRFSSGVASALALQRAIQFKETLEQAGIPCTIRMRRGIDIAAGCGQLAGSVSNSWKENKY
jgi:23S rRNA (adenine2503-C2)-methyltransferase